MAFSNKILRDITKPGTFLHSYIESQSELETPLWYDFWCGMWLLSLAAGRHYIVDRPRIPVFCNLYCVILAESGVTRKSTAVSQALKVATDAKLLTPDRTLLIGSVTTAEKVEKELHERFLSDLPRTVVVAASELVRVLGASRYQATLPGLLVDLYDCPNERRSVGTLARGEVRYTDVACTVLAACAPSWLSESISRDVLRGGFTSRLFYITGEDRKQRIAWPNADNDNAIREVSAERLTNLAHLSSTVQSPKITSDGLGYFTNWYRRLQEPIDEYRRTFQSRQDDHVLKVAALLALNNEDCVVTRDIMRYSVSIVNYLCESGAAIFASTQASPKLVKGIEKLKHILLETDGAGLLQGTITQKTRSLLTNSEMLAVLTAMHELDYVKRYEITTDNRGRKPIRWTPTSKLASAEISTIVKGVE